MRIALALLVSMTATAAFADAPAPPKRYSGEVTAPMTVIKVAGPKVGLKCAAVAKAIGYYAPFPVNSAKNGFTAGCTLQDGNKFVVILLDRPWTDPLGYKWTPKAVLAHELGHVNGWKWNHPR